MQNEAWIEELWRKFDDKMRVVLPRCKGKIPYTTDEHGVYDNKAKSNINWWTNGFFGGLLWIMYEATGYEPYREMAEESELMMDAAFENYGLLDHDVGFLWHILSGANYRITGNTKSRTRNLFAASVLFSRFNPDGNYIRAWNHVEEPLTIIDTMMNLPLLYWASDEIGDDRFKKVAVRHAKMAMRDHIRPDGSVNHMIEHDQTTGDAVKTLGGQGYGDGSSWSRGVAWALYGFILSYIHTKDNEFLDVAKKVAHYFVFCVIGDGFVPRCDFRAPSQPVYYDTTAGAIAACGLIEISKNVKAFEKEAYITAAIKILKGLEKFCNFNPDKDSVLQEGRVRYHDSEQKHIVYGDYFFVEALYKLRGGNMLFW